MNGPRHTVASSDEAASILGVPRNADPDSIRAAYLDLVRSHPPETDPDAFERIRDACRVLQDDARAGGLTVTLDVDPAESLSTLLDQPVFVGPEPWIDVVRDAAARSIQQGG